MRYEEGVSKMIIAISLNHTPLLSQTPCKTEGRAACCDMFVIAGDGPKGCPSGVCTCVALGREGFRECHPAINHLGHALHETTYRREKGGGGNLRTLLARRSSSGVIAAGSSGPRAMVPLPPQAKHRTPPAPPHPSHTTGSPCAKRDLFLFQDVNQSKRRKD